MRATRLGLPRTVVVLGVVSLLNDAASEMITPLLPLFLTATLGAGPAIVGLVEGLALTTASILKLISGRLADLGWSHKRLVAGGYGLSNLVRPLIGLAPGWGSVLGLRFLDRVGKGVRSAPRDALVSACVDRSMRGLAFGYHRAMDHTGAILGPLAAFALIALGMELRDVFLISVVPGVLLMGLLIWGVPARHPAVAIAPAGAPVWQWRALDRRVRALLLAAALLAVATVPDAFLVLWAHEAGLSFASIPLLWAAAHALRAVAAGSGGWLSDSAGRAPVLLSGWLARIALLVLLGMSNASGAAAWGLFLVYAALTAVTEPAEAALVGDHAAEGQKATTLGLYHMLSGLLALPGALLLGVLWQWLGMSAAFLAAAALSALAAITFVGLSRPARRD